MMVALSHQLMTTSLVLMKMLTRYEGREAQNAKKSEEIVPPPLPLARVAKDDEAHHGHAGRDEEQSER